MFWKGHPSFLEQTQLDVLFRPSEASGGQDPAGSVADGVAWSPSSIQPVDEVEPIRHSECSEKREGARGEGDEASRSDATKGVFAFRGGAGSRPQASCETSRSFGHVGRGRRDVPDHQDSSSEGRGPGPGTPNYRADQGHQDVCSSAGNKRRSSRPRRRRRVLSSAQTEQVEQEAPLADGERRLQALLAKERFCRRRSQFHSLQSHRTSRQSSAGCKGIIDSLEQELAHLRCGERLSHTLPDDDDMVADLPHKKAKVGSRTPAVVSGCAPRTPLAITGGHGQSPDCGIHRPYKATPV